jgi:DNA modification methylase
VPQLPEPCWHTGDGDVALYLGDCLGVLATLPDCSVDAVVTDPPYGLEFMGREWDTFKPSSARIRTRTDARTNPADGKSVTSVPEAYIAGQPFQAWCQAWAAECLRVLKPGGHMLTFGGTRTWHRLTCGIEDAGFEIRDSIHWIYGSGFPKSLDVSKAIDKAAGAERTVTGYDVTQGHYDDSPRKDGRKLGSATYAKDAYSQGMRRVKALTAPATDTAARWDGWGTALKPAHEPVVVARKPLTGTVAANVLTHGTGALNIDGCRLGSAAGMNRAAYDDSRRTAPSFGATYENNGGGDQRAGAAAVPDGRWPANVVFTHSAACEMTGTRAMASNARRDKGTGLGCHGGEAVRGTFGAPGRPEMVQSWDCAPDCPVAELDRQSGVRASGANPERRHSDTFRDAYGDFGGQQACTPHRGADSGGASRFYPVFRYQAKAPASERPRLEDGTAHSTVKPVQLMRWLARLVTPPGGIVLDPFGGSGTTAEACVTEGFRCIIVEQDASYAELIKARLSRTVQPAMPGLEAS